MAGRRSCNPHDRWRQTLLASERGRRRANRKHKVYQSEKWLPEHKPTKNPRFKIKGKGHGTLIIKMPKSLDFSSVTARDETVQILSEIKKFALYERHKKIILDFTEVDTISPEVECWF